MCARLVMAFHVCWFGRCSFAHHGSQPSPCQSIASTVQQDKEYIFLVICSLPLSLSRVFHSFVSMIQNFFVNLFVCCSRKWLLRCIWAFFSRRLSSIYVCVHLFFFSRQQSHSIYLVHSSQILHKIFWIKAQYYSKTERNGMEWYKLQQKLWQRWRWSEAQRTITQYKCTCHIQI